MNDDSKTKRDGIETLTCVEEELTTEQAEQAQGGTVQLTRSAYYADPENLAQLGANARQGIWEN